MEQYVINEQDINEMICEAESAICEIINEKMNCKRVEHEEDRDFIPSPVKIILEGYPKLMEYLFDYRNYCLNDNPAKLIEEAGCFSSGEQILIRISLDFWDSTGNTLLKDFFQMLDHKNFNKVLAAIRYARSGK